MTPTDEFLEVYKQLEQAANEHYGIDPETDHTRYGVAAIEADPAFANFADDLHVCRELRNLYSHHSQKEGASLAVATPEAIALLKKLVVEFERPLAADALMVRDMLSASLADNVFKVMNKMRHNGYTNVPVLNNGVLEGVFSQGTVFSYLIDSGGKRLDSTTSLSAFKDLLPFESHKGESYAFVAINTTLSQLEKMFDDALAARHRMGMVFVTQTGQATEPLLGIITAWDLVGK